MKTVSIVVCLLFASGAFAADCHTNLRGQTVCSNGQSAAAVNPSIALRSNSPMRPSGSYSRFRFSDGERGIRLPDCPLF